MKAILIERDYKGIYERFALTPDEFIAEFPDIANITTQGTYTISPMVHIWYSPCIVGDNMWNLFFTDMTWGLPDTDINIGNLARWSSSLIVRINSDSLLPIRTIRLGSLIL